MQEMNLVILPILFLPSLRQNDSSQIFHISQYTTWLTRSFFLNDRFKIQDDEIGKDDLAAWACIRLDRLRSGYRFVHLLDAAGRESNGVLLVGIEKVLI